METPLVPDAPPIPPTPPLSAAPFDPYAQAPKPSSLGWLKVCGGCLLAVVLVVSGCSYYFATFGPQSFIESIVKRNLPPGSEVHMGSVQDLGTAAKQTTPPSILPVEGFTSGWISDVPLYPGATRVSDSQMTFEKKDAYTATLTTSDPYTKVYTWYRDELPKQGWAIPMAYSTSDEHLGFLSAIKGERMGEMHCTTKDAVTTISLTFSIN